MPFYWVILLIIGIGASTLNLISQRAEQNSKATDASSIARNLLIYRNALAEYAHSNQAVTGAVDDTVLGLPSWYIHLPGIYGYVLAGSSYTYYPTPPEGLVAELVKITDASLAVGYVQAGQLISPSAGATGISTPSVVPNGAAITFQ